MRKIVSDRIDRISESFERGKNPYAKLGVGDINLIKKLVEHNAYNDNDYEIKDESTVQYYGKRYKSLTPETL